LLKDTAANWYSTTGHAFTVFSPALGADPTTKVPYVSLKASRLWESVVKEEYNSFLTQFAKKFTSLPLLSSDVSHVTSKLQAMRREPSGVALALCAHEQGNPIPLPA